MNIYNYTNLPGLFYNLFSGSTGVNPDTYGIKNIPNPDIKPNLDEIPTVIITKPSSPLFPSPTQTNIPLPDPNIIGDKLPILNPDNITILSPNMFIYTKDAGVKGDKLLDGIREILDKII
jgi:hypothetical protein